jgi:hypothetical protein
MSGANTVGSFARADVSSFKVSIRTRVRDVVGERSPFGPDCVDHGDRERIV